MKRGASIAAWLALLAAIVAAVVAIVCVRGCRTRPPKDDRTKDAAYIQSLKDVMKDRKGLVKARNETVAEMQSVIDRARAALPEGATEADIKAELEGHPEKYPEWKALNGRIAADNAAIEASLKEARERVRARILKQKGAGAAQRPPASATKKAG